MAGLSPKVGSNDFNGDGQADLAVGVAEEDLGGIVHAGAVNVLFGSPSGLPGSSRQLVTQDSPGVADSAEDGDGFGHTLD